MVYCCTRCTYIYIDLCTKSLGVVGVICPELLARCLLLYSFLLSRHVFMFFVICPVATYVRVVRGWARATKRLLCLSLFSLRYPLNDFKPTTINPEREPCIYIYEVRRRRKNSVLLCGFCWDVRKRYDSIYAPCRCCGHVHAMIPIILTPGWSTLIPLWPVI